MYRQIHTDGRQLPVDPDPNWYGYSIGRWEGETFVVDTAGFKEGTWLDNSGHPHTEALKITERFRRINFGRLESEATIDDPKAYSRPWTSQKMTFLLQPDTELLEHLCESNRDLGRLQEIYPTAAGGSIVANWFTSMNVREKRTFWACFTGWALDAMDVQLYAVVMPTLIAAWAMSQAQAGTLATAALLFSSVGGWLAGILADRYGRAAVLRLTIVWFALFTFLSGFTQSFEQLLFTRSMQGLGFGGEWAAGAVLMSEVIDKRIRGRAVGSVQSGWSVGYGAAVLLFTIVFSVAPPEMAWRYLFFLGLLPAFFALWIRRYVEEPQVFREMRAHAAGGRTFQFLEIFGPGAAAPHDSWRRCSRPAAWAGTT